MQELNYRPKGIALLEFPLRAGSPARRTITNVRVGKISVYPGGPRPSRVLFLPGNCRILLELIGDSAYEEHHRGCPPVSPGSSYRTVTCVPCVSFFSCFF